MRTFRRWFLRVLAFVALCGVGYAVYTIVKEGTKDDKKSEISEVEPALKKLAKAQLVLGNKLDHLQAGRKSPTLSPAVKATLADWKAAGNVVRRRRAKNLDVENVSQLDDALGAEFDYLDALSSIVKNKKSKLIKSIANRAQDAKDAFTKLPNSQGIEDGIKGTQAFLVWARARN